MENSNLVKLIKTLEKNEKRYIAIYLSRHKTNNNLLKLFNAIRNNDPVSDTIIIQQVNDKKFTNQLKINKHKLYYLILDALHNFHMHKSVYGKIVKLLHQAEILSLKGLNDARGELLKKAGQLADQYEMTELKLEVLRLRNLELRDKLLLRGIYNETTSLIKRIGEENQIKYLNNRMSLYQRKAGLRVSSSQMKYLEKQLEKTINNKYFTEDTFFSRFFYYRILSLLQGMLGNTKESYINDMKILALYNEKPHMKDLQIWRDRYISSLSRLITSASLTGNGDVLLFISNEINDADISDRRKAFADINITDTYMHLGEFEKSIPLLERIEDNIDFYNKNLDTANRTALYYNLAVLNFGLEQYPRSLTWINSIINNLSDGSSDIGINNIVRILRLVIYYELGHFDVLEYDLRSTYRYIMKQKEQYEFDRIVLNHIRQSVKVYDDHEKIKKAMEQTRHALNMLAKTKPEEQQILSYFDFIAWFDSKIQNRKYSDIVQEQVRMNRGN